MSIKQKIKKMTKSERIILVELLRKLSANSISTCENKEYLIKQEDVYDIENVINYVLDSRKDKNKMKNDFIVLNIKKALRYGMYLYGDFDYVKASITEIKDNLGIVF